MTVYSGEFWLSELWGYDGVPIALKILLLSVYLQALGQNCWLRRCLGPCSQGFSWDSGCSLDLTDTTFCPELDSPWMLE